MTASVKASLGKLLFLVMMFARIVAFQPWRTFPRQQFLFRSTSSTSLAASQKIAIVGGGLAGLSTAYHLLEQTSSSLEVTIWDKEEQVGKGGASAVAGGLVHPLSPRGKLVHWGREGLAATNRLVNQACRALPNRQIVLRSEIFRVATSEKQALQLQETAQQLSDLLEWMDSKQLAERLSNPAAFGGLRLHNGCQVVHLPSYLHGLYAACCQQQDKGSVQWKQMDWQQNDSLAALQDYDVVVWAAGSGLFQSSIQSPIPEAMPIQLVRGQSLEVRLSSTFQQSTPCEALLSGKYVSPLPESDRVLVGATHEFQSKPLTHAEVRELLQEKTELFAPHVWQESSVVEDFTTGVRVQSQRGNRGRLPIIGKLDDRNWIFTGLSSRGLLYHGVYGKVLAQAILEGSEESLKSNCDGYDWWRFTT